MALLLACIAAEDTGSPPEESDPPVVDTAPPWTPPTVWINEFMADNEGSLFVDEATPDWVELFNSGDEEVDLTLWSLSDDAKDPARQRIGSVIEAGGLLLVPLDFGLAAEGEQVGLYAPGGAPIDRVDFGAQQPDVAAARRPDGGTDWVYVFGGSPGASNP